MTAPPAGALEACLALLPCPFCGEAPEGPVQIASKVWKVSCARNLRHDAHAMSWESADDAIASWNRRAHGPALLAALRLREGWIPVSERLPERWEHVDVWPDPRDETYSFYALADGGTNGVKAGRWYYNDRDGYDTEIRVTHWRPLPAPPTADDLARVLEEGE